MARHKPRMQSPQPWHTAVHAGLTCIQMSAVKKIHTHNSTTAWTVLQKVSGRSHNPGPTETRPATASPTSLLQNSRRQISCAHPAVLWSNQRLHVIDGVNHATQPRLHRSFGACKSRGCDEREVGS